LVRVSREQWRQPSTGDQLSTSVARAITRRGDVAFVAEANPTPPAVAPVGGLVNTGGLVDGGMVGADLDVIVDLISALESNWATPTHILVSPTSWAALRKLKTGTDFNSSLLGAGSSDATQSLFSLPVLVNNAVPDYVGLVVDSSAIVSAVGPVMVSNSEHQ
jgi:HK97 family phage major capsid protein